jgi:hypothetical protein
MQEAQYTSLLLYEAVTATRAYRDFNLEYVSIVNQLDIPIDDIAHDPVSNASITNKHFDIPKPVDPFYSGCEDYENCLHS